MPELYAAGLAISLLAANVWAFRCLRAELKQDAAVRDHVFRRMGG